ncbi:MAG: PKD domain-containing protein [Haloplanus sp.]
MRRLGLLVVVGLLLSGGYATAQTSPDSVTITNTEDADCDDKYAAFDLTFSFAYDRSADVFSQSDPYVVVEYATADGFTELTRFDEVPLGSVDRTLSLTAADLGGLTGETRFRITAYDADLLTTQRLRAVESRTVGVEPPSEEVATLEPTFGWSPSSPRRGEPVSFVAQRKSESGCPIETWHWDFDGDGTTEATGRTVSHTFERDGYHTVELEVVDSQGRAASVTHELLVVFDPDGDGVTNAIERDRGTNPNDIDTDGDLFSDGTDPFPASFLVPTGVAHAVLAVIVYVGAFRTRWG